MSDDCVCCNSDFPHAPDALDDCMACVDDEERYDAGLPRPLDEEWP